MFVAVTGGSGFIGQWLLRTLGDQHSLLILGRDLNKKELIVDDKEFKYFVTDYSVDSLLKILENCEAVVHLSAKRSGKEHGTFLGFADNVLISANLFEACKILKIRNIVNVSSVAVYSYLNQLPWAEDQNIHPLSFYGISKATTEELADYYNYEHGLRIKTLRLAQVVGMGEREGFLLMEFVKRAFNKQILYVYGKGQGRREYIYVKDVVDAIAAVLKYPGEFGVFNVGTDKNIYNYELAEVINDVFDNRNNLKFLSDYPEDKTTRLMSSEKAKNTFNWQAKWSLKDAFWDMKKSMDSIKL